MQEISWQARVVLFLNSIKPAQVHGGLEAGGASASARQQR